MNLIELAGVITAYAYVGAVVALGPISVAFAVRELRRYPFSAAVRDEEQLELEVAA